MIYFDTPCEQCIHYRGLINSWRSGCDAFPDGFPWRFTLDNDVRTLEECANGYKWEPKDEDSGT